MFLSRCTKLNPFIIVWGWKITPQRYLEVLTNPQNLQMCLICDKVLCRCNWIRTLEEILLDSERALNPMTHVLTGEERREGWDKGMVDMGRWRLRRKWWCHDPETSRAPRGWKRQARLTPEFLTSSVQLWENNCHFQNGVWGSLLGQPYKTNKITQNYLKINCSTCYKVSSLNWR